MGKLLILVGTPRSGKSTYANDFIDTLIPEQRVVINPDSIRIALHGTSFTMDQLHSNGELMVKMILRTVVKALYNDGYYVCVDACNCHLEDIKYWLSIDRNAEFKYISTSLEVCKERARQVYPPLVYTIDAVWGYIVDLVRKNHPDISIRMCGLRSDEELVNETTIYETLEEIRRNVG